MKRRVVEGKELPWSKETYVTLHPGDLLPTPAPTAEQRIRVAAALATIIRDERMLGRQPAPNGETIRAVLVMDAASWARDIGLFTGVLAVYDAVDPRVRFEQTEDAYR